MELKKIVLITTGQPSTNPRLVKEADALVAKGYNICVIYQFWDIWAEEADKKLLPHKKWKSICVGGKPNSHKLLYWFTRLGHKFFRLLHQYLGHKFNLAEFTVCRNTYLLYLCALKQNADLYIAHNLGALAPAVWAAREKKVKCGFDAEDFHRHERNSNPNDEDVKLKTYLENKYFSQLSYLTTASPLINKEYESLFPQLRPVAINNVFKKYLHKPSKPYEKNSPLKLFWFSQKIGPDRGIEDVFRALKIIEEEEIEFHILGKPRPDIILEFERLIQSLNFYNDPEIFYHQPMDSEALMYFTTSFDIGLCLEPGFSRNNEIALSNKLFTYLNVGLAIICTETPAQAKFILENPNIGKTYPIGNAEALAKLLLFYKKNPSELNQAKLSAYELAQRKYNWEIEQEKLLSLISPLLI